MRNVLRPALLGLVLLVLGSGPASAHAALVESDPSDGSTSAQAPPTITLTFNENVATPAYVTVTAPDGAPVEVSDIRAVDRTVTASVADVDKRGDYTVAYRVVSADGHPVQDTLTYTVTTGRVVEQVDQPEQQGFVHRHRAHLFWGLLAAAVAIALLLSPLRRRHDPDDA